jgi:molybdopterin-guanine dinucleotide biosynthesis protein A
MAIYAVALVLMCAGSSSRFGTGDKFLAPFDVKGSPTLMDLIFGNLKKVTKDLKTIPIVVSCSASNLNAIQCHLKDKEYYGLEEHCFTFSCATSFVVLDA